MKRKRTARRQAVVTLSDSELSQGITKLSGSRPCLKVRTATPYETAAIMGPARAFRDSKIAESTRRSFGAKTPCARRRAMNEKKRNHNVDEMSVPLISGRLFLMDL